MRETQTPTEQRGEEQIGSSDSLHGNEAWEQLYRESKRSLSAISRRRYGMTSDEIEDLVQETWLRFLEKQSVIEQPKPWLTGTLVNLCKQQIDRNVRTRELIVASLTDSTDEAMPITEIPADALMLQRALRNLEPRAQNLCRLIAIEGESYEEVSRHTGLPIGSIGPLYIRAKKKLRQQLAGQQS